MKLIFKIRKAGENGRSPIEIVISWSRRRAGSRQRAGKNFVSAIIENTDLLLPTLDKLLKKNKIELESLKDINIEIANGAGLTSTRIVLSISKALKL